jgi:hypothetical protein
VNDALREHVTSSKFTLTLGATHIAALVWIDWQLLVNLNFDELSEQQSALVEPPRSHTLYRTFQLVVPGMHGLIQRGLVTHTRPANRGVKPADIWTITTAGQMVVGLLKEAGIWQEYASALPPIPRPVEAAR